MIYEFDVKVFFVNNKLIFNVFGASYIVVLPFFYFFTKKIDKVSLLFTSKYFYKSVLSYIVNVLFRVSNVFFFRLRLKGLGYKIKRYLGNFYRFFFGFKHYFYLYVPSTMLMRSKRRKFVVLSKNLCMLNNFFSQLLLLKKLDYYERNNTFMRPLKIIYVKKFK